MLDDQLSDLVAMLDEEVSPFQELCGEAEPNGNRMSDSVIRRIDPEPSRSLPDDL
jgi:hypothetical protein